VSGAETTAWTIVIGFRDHYMVPWPEGRVAVGATRETGSGFDPRPTAAGVREVLAEALRVAPGLADAEILEIRVGLRPLSTDGLPVLGAVPGIEGVYLATGHGPTGLQLGPYSGKVLAALMLGRGLDVDLAPFRPGRFQGPG
jgi:D-amino-acid dehydrogenase